MTFFDIAHQRLHNQHVSSSEFAKPEDVVAWLGAVQAQDYAGAKWAVGQRTRGLTDRDVERACDDGLILRTHVLRPTWHFVTPTDIRWILAVTAPRVHALNAYYYRKLELGDEVFAGANTVLTNALRGGKHLTRNELRHVFREAGIDLGVELRFSYIMMHAELDAIVCSGVRRGKQFTYALLEERAPQAKTLTQDEALAELAKRYFQSHGPATVKDFVWWSSLTMAEAKAAIAMASSYLNQDVIEGTTYWFTDSATLPQISEPVAYLLPNYDEYISYSDRNAIFDSQHDEQMDPSKNIVFAHFLVINGQVVGTWQRTFKKDLVIINMRVFHALTPAEGAAVAAAADRYGAFIGMRVVFS